jgi:hypothetical protein
MDQNIGVTSDGRCEMGVQLNGQTIMESFHDLHFSEREVDGLIHTSCGHDSDQFVEEGIVWSSSLVEAISELF